MKTTRIHPRRKGKPAPRIKPKRIEDPAHLARVRALPCVVCGMTPSEAHHIREGSGMGQKAGDHEAISLCPYHHQTGPFGEAVHNGKRTFEAKYGTELELLEHVQALLEIGEAI